jgi:hypothetical protein
MDTLKKLVEESKLIDASKKAANSVEYEKILNDAANRLAFIVGKVKFSLINIFRLDNEEDSHDIEMSILRAFLNSRRIYFDKTYVMVLKRFNFCFSFKCIIMKATK